MRGSLSSSVFAAAIGKYVKQLNHVGVDDTDLPKTQAEAILRGSYPMWYPHVLGRPKKK